MQKQEVQFATKVRNGVVVEIGRSVIYTPKTFYSGRTTKWFDDSKLLKVNHNNQVNSQQR